MAEVTMRLLVSIEVVRAIFVTLMLTDVASGEPQLPQYDQLERECEGSSCCISSVRTMRMLDAVLATNRETCPQGYERDMLRCIDSYVWCVPTRRTPPSLPTSPSMTPNKLPSSGTPSIPSHTR